MKLRTPLLITVSLLLIVPIWTTSCDDAFEGATPRRDTLNFPIGVTFHPNGEYLYVVNSNFDARYSQEAGGTISVVDAESLDILPERTPFVPAFSSFVELNADASKAYVSSRAGDAIVAYDVADDGSALFCVDEEGNQTSDPGDCVLERVPDEPGGALLPADPFGLDVYSIERDVGTVDVVNLAHLGSNRVSTIALPQGDLSAASLQTAPLLDRSNAIARRPGTQHLYAAGRNENRVGIYQPYINRDGEVEALVDRGSFFVNNSRTPRTNEPMPVDARALEFDEEGETLFVISQRPAALHVVDVVPADPDTGQGTEHRPSASIPLPTDPSDLELHTTPGGQRLAYVASFEDRSIQVVDIDSETIIDEIELDASPYKIAIEPPASGCTSIEERCRAFVTLFDDTQSAADQCEDSASGCGSVAVIDINPQSRDPENPELSRYHTVISKIQ